MNDFTTVYLVRHGEVHNPTGIIYGRLPRFGLSKAGWQQARDAASVLATEPLATVYTSPQLRARQTAAALLAGRPAVDMRISALLSEVATSWQGRLPRPSARLFDFYDECWSEGDETIGQIARRVQALMLRLIRRHRGQKVACVSHGDPIAIALAFYGRRPLTLEGLRSLAYPRLASVTSLEFRGDQVRIKRLHPASAGR